ncbi:MAG: sigma factor, partial [Micrococcales bacterium]|nr:sigma factor [Micrococcales bacterium]
MTTTDHQTTTDLDTTAETDPDWAPPSWEEVVQEHSARVYRLAYRLTGNVYDAEDLTHDVFIRVFRSLGSYRPGTFEGWLHRIT